MALATILDRPAAAVARPALSTTDHHAGPITIRAAKAALNGALQVVPVLDKEFIHDITLRLRARSFTTLMNRALVFGDEDLAEEASINDMIAHSGRANPHTLHVFFRVADMMQLTVKTLLRELTLCNTAAEAAAAAVPPTAPASNMSALTEVLSSSHAAGSSWAAAEEPGASATDVLSGTCSEVAAALGATAVALVPLGPAALDASRTVVHLTVPRSARVHWRRYDATTGDDMDTFELSISSVDTVESLMRKLEAAVAAPSDDEGAGGPAINAGGHRIVCNGEVLASGRPLASYGIGKGSVLELQPVVLPPAPAPLVLAPAYAAAAARPPALTPPLPGSPLLDSPLHELHSHWQRARAGLAEGRSPWLAPAGTGGSYFLADAEGLPCAVLKPADEEPLAANNPRGHGPSDDGQGMRRGTRPGEGALREVAAYLLDHGGFAGVPPTALVACELSQREQPATSACARDGKLGSLQEFVEAEGDCEERGSAGFPVDEVHKIAVLDMRLGNTDRNGGNILAQRTPEGGWRLVPIDHGYCLPASWEDVTFEWLYWPQAEQPLSAATREYIAALSAERDIALLASHGIALRAECLRTLRVGTLVLQRGAAAGLTPSQIGCILSRQATEERSPVEEMHEAALADAAATGAAGADFEAAYMCAMEARLERHLEDAELGVEEALYL